MGVLIYDAKRFLTGGHGLGSEQKIETAFTVDDQDTKETGSLRRSLGGATEYELDRIDDLVTVQSDVVLETDKLFWKEFTTSVQAREAFKIDLTGTIAVPGTVLNCIIEKNAGFHPRRTQPGVQTYRFSFTVRLI